MPTLRVTVCELPDPPDGFERAWDRLAAHVRENRSDLVLLNEMPFAPWFARTRAFDSAVWDEAVRLHDVWIERLGELGASMVAGSRPVYREGKRVNVGFAYEREGGAIQHVHVKSYLPNEDGYWEASWYDAGSRQFDIAETTAGRVGIQICTDLWSLGDAQRLGKQGAQLLLIPRATPRSSVDKWLAGGRTAGVVAGAFCLSSNRSDAGDGLFGGLGWVTDPEGQVLAVTSASEPFHTVAVDLHVADAAKSTYPRYALP